MNSPSSAIWIKGWFDGDYSAIPGIKRQSAADTENTLVRITSGRLTAIELVNGPPEKSNVSRQLRQEEGVPKVLLQAPDGLAWISPIQDLHLIDWESDSTGEVLTGGGPRVGRLVGWAFAKVSDPRLFHTPKQTRLSQSNVSSTEVGEGTNTFPLQSNYTSATLDDSQTAQPASPPPNQSTDSIDSATTPFKNFNDQIEQAPLPHPCKVCAWVRALIFFVIVWFVCSLGWAFLAISPLLIRCLATFLFRSAWTTSDRQQLLESVLFLFLGISAFLYLIWSALVECKGTSTFALIFLFLLVASSFRTRFCWLINTISWLWYIAILINCQGLEGTCRALPQIVTATSQAIGDTQNKLNQIFRPDRDAQEISGQSSPADGWKRISVEEAEKRPEKFFNCVERPESRRDQYIIYMGESALFELNQYTLSDKSEPQLNRIGRLIQRYPQSNLIVVGHADKSPHINGPEGNLAISEKRAYSVVDWLTNGNFVKPDQIVAMGAGDRYPLFDTPYEFRGNRRVEIRVICPVSNL